VTVPGPTATINVPLVVNATDPSGRPPFVFHEITDLVSPGMLIAHTPSAAPPHSWLVEVYSRSPTAIKSEKRAPSGRNCAGRCRSLPDTTPSVRNMPSPLTA
jgi:hypothetical protein